MCCTPVLCVQNSADLAAVLSLLPARELGPGGLCTARDSRAGSRVCRAPPGCTIPTLCPDLIHHSWWWFHLSCGGDWHDLSWENTFLSLPTDNEVLVGFFRKKVAGPPKMQLIPDFLPRIHAKPYQASLEQQLQEEHLGEDLVLTHLPRRVKGLERPLKLRCYSWPHPSRMEAGGDSSQCWCCCWAGQGHPCLPDWPHCQGRERGCSQHSKEELPLFLISSLLPHKTAKDHIAAGISPITATIFPHHDSILHVVEAIWVFSPWEPAHIKHTRIIHGPTAVR